LDNAIYKAIEAALAIEAGNVLVFLPGEREINQAIKFLAKTRLKHYAILPLYSRQSEAEQNLIFKDSAHLKIIITTNVAETSLTIPGIKYVIDSGLARVKRYNVRTRVEQLQIEKISQASCKQRAGRAGRLSHGMCIRLYSQADYNLRPEFTTPEILRSNLSNVILQLISLKLGNPREFSFMDMPEPKSYNDGFKILYQLRALDEKEHITTIGRLLTRLPIDVSLARILYAGVVEYNLANPLLVIVSFLVLIDPRQFPLELQHKALEVQQIWHNPDSEFITIINLWVWYQKLLLSKPSRSQLQQTLHAHFLNAKRISEWSELYLQLKGMLKNLVPQTTKQSQLTIAEELMLLEQSKSYIVGLHQALLTGLINNIGQKDLVENYYLGTQGKKFVLTKTSAINKPKWVVAANLVLTSQLFARTVAKIEPQWLISVTRHLVKYNYSDYHFDIKRGEVVAHQATLLYGLLIDNSKVALNKIDSKLAHEIFIKQGLVAPYMPQLEPLIANERLSLSNKVKLNQVNDISGAGFIIHNQQVIKQLVEWEYKHRSSFIVWDDDLFNFYSLLIPDYICDMRSFSVWYKDNENILKINYQEWLDKHIDNSQSIKLYPDYLVSNGIKIGLKYVFQQGSTYDGINAYIPLEQLNLIDEHDFLWLVPGMIRDKIAHIIKLLPKTIRIGLNPHIHTITDFLQTANLTNDFNQELANYINRRLQTSVTLLQLEKLTVPPHLKVHFIILNKDEVVYSGDSLVEARDTLSDKLNQIVSKVAVSQEISPILGWIPQLSELLKENKITLSSRTIIAYNTLMVKDDGSIAYLTTNSYTQALQNTRKGIFYLIKLQLASQIKFIRQKQFVNFKQSALYLSNIYANKNDLLEQAIDFIIRMSGDLTSVAKSELEFNQLVAQLKNQLSESVVVFANLLYQVASNYHQILRKVANHPLREVILVQLDDLIFSDFLRFVSYANFQHFPRYLQAIIYRLNKYSNNMQKDIIIGREIQQVYDKWYNIIEELEEYNKPVGKELYNFKYKIEELRVSLFAQELKTQYPVSVKRLNKELDECFN
jgi:ATP-dependent helicase HrpA